MALFTTYLSALRKVKYCGVYVFPKSGISVKLLYVMRRRGNDAVAPSESLLLMYKAMQKAGASGAFEMAKTNYLKEIMGSDDAKRWIDRVALESKHMDIILVCYEKDPNLCHRTILAHEIVFRHPEVEFLGEIMEFQHRPERKLDA